MINEALKQELIENGWWEHTKHIFESNKYRKLRDCLIKEYAEGPVYPSPKKIMRALTETKFDDIKVVVVGQDPYHTPYMANGLAFAVNKGSIRPPSLKNIFRELESDLDVSVPATSCTLEGWAKQGVLLLNTCLTVKAGQPGSHANIGWEWFTGEILKVVSEKKPNTVFILWGKKAEKVEKFFVKAYNLNVLRAGHPSPLSANLFFGCKHFSKTNEILKKKGLGPINWLKINSLQESEYGEFIGQIHDKSYSG